MSEGERVIALTDIPSIKALQLGERLGRGGNNDVYSIAGHRDLVARISHTTWEGNLPMITAMKKLHDTVPNEVNLARILSVGLDDQGKAVAIMERAPGNVTHERNAPYSEWSQQISMLAHVDPAQYAKLLQDQRILSEHGLKIDPSKTDNLFYDKDVGFTYIDLNEGSEIYSLVSVLLDTGAIYNRLRGKLQDNDRKNIEIIIHLLKQAGDGVTDSQVNEIRSVALDKG